MESIRPLNDCTCFSVPRWQCDAFFDRGWHNGNGDMVVIRCTLRRIRPRKRKHWDRCVSTQDQRLVQKKGCRFLAARLSVSGRLRSRREDQKSHAWLCQPRLLNARPIEETQFSRKQVEDFLALAAVCLCFSLALAMTKKRITAVSEGATLGALG